MIVEPVVEGFMVLYQANVSVTGVNLPLAPIRPRLSMICSVRPVWVISTEPSGSWLMFMPKYIWQDLHCSASDHGNEWP